MPIVCPYCRHGMSIKDARPGRYKPKCSKCERRFRLTIPSQPGADPLVEPIADEGIGPVASDASLTSTAVASPTATLPASDVSVRAADSAASTKTSVDEIAKTSPQPLPPSAINETQLGSGEDATRVGSVDATLVAEAKPTVYGGGTVVETKLRDGSSLPMRERLGAYRLLRELGRGAMGAVYLAKQISLNRDVALKTIQPEWCDNPSFIARFIREAYAAAQLTHHNVVQIYDLGCDNGVNYFSMEFINGESLQNLVDRRGRLPPREAVGYILQAARGLQFAHNNGIVHRDVKPANLMLNDHGVVKVADLGLVKAPQLAMANDDVPHSGGLSLASAAGDVTLANVAMGTPAYMAPEQAEDAAGVDHRADIYSLGCSLYVLLTGRLPFEGSTALEVITKHRSEPVLRPDAVVQGIPRDLSEIVLKMVAKKPEARFVNLDEVIQALERTIAGDRKTVEGPTDEHARVLGDCAGQFNGSRAAKLRAGSAIALLSVALGTAAISLLFNVAVAGGFLALAITAVLAYFIVKGIHQPTHLFHGICGSIFQARWSDRAMWLGGLLLVALVLLVTGWLWTWLVLIGCGLAAGLAFHFVFDRRVELERQPVVERAGAIVKELRLSGLSESAIQDFVVRAGGDHWEDFFECLFGYEARLAAAERRAVNQPGARTRRIAAWRDMLIRRIDAQLAAAKAEKDRRHLERVEEAGLKAQGLKPVEARAQARQLAAAIVDEAAGARQLATVPNNAPIDPAVVAAQKRARIKAMLADARSEGSRNKGPGIVAILTAPLRLMLGAKVRFVTGALLLAGCLLWMNQNGMLSEQQLRQTASAIESRQIGSAVNDIQSKSAANEPLKIPVVGRLFDGFNSGVAGVLLLVLAIARGWKMSLFALPAAGIAWLGPSLGVPGIAAIGGSHTSSIVIGATLGAVGLIFGRTRD